MGSTSKGVLFFAAILIFIATLLGLESYGQDINPDPDVKACIAELKTRLNRPLSFERTLGTTSNDDVYVRFEYTAQNGFGNTIPGRVECLVSSIDGSVVILKTFD